MTHEPPAIASAMNALDHSLGFFGAPGPEAGETPNALGRCSSTNQSRNITPSIVPAHDPIHLVAMLSAAAMNANAVKYVQNKCHGINDGTSVAT